MILHTDIAPRDLHKKIRSKEILFGGNLRLKIYGQLNCRSGKKLKKENRIFFITEQEALVKGFRPCGHCLISKYKKWKSGIV